VPSAKLLRKNAGPRTLTQDVQVLEHLVAHQLRFVEQEDVIFPAVVALQC